MPHHSRGRLLLTKAISGLSRVRTKLRQLCVIPSVPPDPVEADGEHAGHGDFCESKRCLGRTKFLTDGLQARAKWRAPRLPAVECAQMSLTSPTLLERRFITN